MTIADLIADRAAVAGTATAGRPCRFGAVLDDLTDTDRAAVLDALDNNTIGLERLAAIVTSGGHPISHATIRRHKRRYCGCRPVSGAAS